MRQITIFYNIYWGNNQNGPSIDITNNINAGKLKAELDLRDQYLKSYLDRLNTLTENLIFETNKLHSKGYGDSFFTNITSNNGVSTRDLDLAMDSTMSGKINEGQIVFSIFNANGEFIGNKAIYVNPTSDSLNDIVERINKDENLPLKAAITGDNKLQIYTEDGYSFAIADDTTNLLAALQINAFLKEIVVKI